VEPLLLRFKAVHHGWAPHMIDHRGSMAALGKHKSQCLRQGWELANISMRVLIRTSENPEI